MSEASSPTKGISNWWKQLKKNTNTSNDSLDSHHLRISDVLTHSHNNSSSSLTRPSLNFKSRSFNSVRRPSGDNRDFIRQQRDEFIASQQKLGFGSSEIFGVSLDDAIKIAESSISVPSDDPTELISYGKIPLLIGKCGSFLKDKGLEVEGIFRIAGASRRVKELQYIFSTPPDYGRKLNWEGYTVHDAASLFRRFLNNLPEPLVPLELYEEFREPVKSRPRILNHIKARNDTIDKRIRQIQERKQKEALGEVVSGDDDELQQPERTEQQKLKDSKRIRKISKDIRHALKEYKVLIDKLPESQKHLLFYLLDMLSMFTKSSKENLMPARNLAAIFQPSILSHPSHDLTPEEYALSQIVVEVLIEHLDKLLPDVDSTTPTTRQHQISNGIDSPNGAGSLSKAGSTKNSSVNLLAVRNSSKGSRPHSRSLSSTNGVPDGITKGISETKQHNSEEEDDDTTDEEAYQDAPLVDEFPIAQEPSTSKTQPIPIPKITTQNIISQPTSPPDSSDKTKSTEGQNWSARTVSDTRQRPVSMFPGAITHHLHISNSHSSSHDDERTSRWLSKSPPAGEENGKKGSWFSRLRSSSRNRNDE